MPPEGETDSVLARLGLVATSTEALPAFRHVFTHFRLTLKPVLCHVAPDSACREPGLVWIELPQAAKAGVPTPIRKLIRQVASAAG